MTGQETSRALFGGKLPWNPVDWASSNDTVRGGASTSSLSPSADTKTVSFEGVLDTTKLGGAGFASQTTKSETTSWDLKDFDGISLIYRGHDSFQYTFKIKDCMPDRRQDGRRQSAIEHEFTFKATVSSEQGSNPITLFMPWTSFKPFYRGRPSTDAEPLDAGNIRGFSIMARSFFDKQSGPFKLTMVSVSASRKSSQL